jgi:cytochrome P450
VVLRHVLGHAPAASVSAPGRALTVEQAARVFATPAAYADEEHFHAATALLRRDEPFPWVEVDGYPSFRAVTRHADVYDISTHHQAWRNEPRSVLLPLAVEAQQKALVDVKSLVNLDGPKHRKLREVTADWFKPRALARLDARISQLAAKAVRRMVELDGECDFATEIAMPFPLEVILSLLGLPDADYPRMLKLTQEVFGTADPELARGAGTEAYGQALFEFAGYFAELVTERRATPTDDLASVIANATVDGEPIELVDQLSYYMIIATAGHDTTSASIAGGLLALAEHPAQLALLRKKPELIPKAVEEIIRWVTPVKSFMRTAAVPYDVGGRHFEPGDAVLLSYWSANRDESAFVDPMRFDVAREPNRHLAFGFGAHYCLGAVLARMEIRALLTELLPRLGSLALAGRPSLSEAVFVGGLKHLPLRYDVSARAGD